MQQKRNIFLYKSAVVANILAFTCGVASAWTSPILPKLNGTINPKHPPLGQPITPSEESWIVALLSLGAIVGPIFAGPLADILGRKKILIIFSCPILGSFLMMAVSKKVTLFYVARLIMGIGVGGIYTILPTYLVEISEDHNRGTLCSMAGVFITAGLLFAYAIGPFFSVSNFCFICAGPLVVFLMLFPRFNPESIYYLAAVNKHEDLMRCLFKLRKKTPGQVMKEAFGIINLVQDLNQRKGGLKELLLRKSPRKAFLISLSLLTLQQFSGVTAVLAYMESIFHSTDSKLSPELSTVFIGVTQVFATIAATTLADKIGRRPLLLISTIGSSVSLTTLGVYFYLLNRQFYIQAISWLPHLSLVMFVIAFSLGLASVPSTMTAELFPSNVKSIALILTTIFTFVGSFIVTFYFSDLVRVLGMAQSFWAFAVVCFLGSVFVFIKVPETKGKSLQEIQFLLEH